MRYHLFLQYGWFLQNLGKDFIPTNMHTTVIMEIKKKTYIPYLFRYMYVKMASK
jgi:hypothetical protein